MKTLKKVEIKPVFVEFIPEIMEQDILYISEKYKCANHLCLCGCGEQTITPLHDKGWKLIRDGDKVSLTPSIGNFCFPCKSHYIITNNITNFV